MRRDNLTATQRAERDRLADHVAGFSLAMLFLVAANASMSRYPWVLWPLAIWGALLVAHALVVVRHGHTHEPRSYRGWI